MDKNELRQKYTATDVLHHFGISINRHGFINCISHTDKTASMKVYKNNIHCFACQQSHDIFQIYAVLSNRTSDNFNDLIASFCADFGETYQTDPKRVKTNRGDDKQVRIALWKCRTEQARIADYRKRIYNGVESKQDEWVRACRQDRHCRDWIRDNYGIKREMEEEWDDRKNCLSMRTL